MTGGVRWGDRHVPAGVRSLLGLVAIAGGVLGFLPVLGFRMVPLGAAVVALDIPPLRRRLLDRLERRRRRSAARRIKDETAAPRSGH
ncbi:MAG: hypothetical protein L6R19_25845 [Alphaproteobacteria bacterium]|nr:hypothetical protein [Alphaproteobacteria bacterium]